MNHPRPVALVTGGSRGIGRAIALALADEGHDIVVNYAQNSAAADEVCHLILAKGASAVAVQAEISDDSARRHLLDQTLARFGRVDLLVNNAGVAPAVRADILEATADSFDRVIGINLKGPYFLTQLVANRMIEQIKSAPQSRLPKIVTISSVSAIAASTNRGDYCVAKAGLAMVTKLFAIRLAEFGINVYEIRPGIVETDMTAGVKEKYDRMIADGLALIARWGRPEDVAKAVVAIARDLFPFSTGEVLHVDGGFHVRKL